MADVGSVVGAEAITRAAESAPLTIGLGILAAAVVIFVGRAFLAHLSKRDEAAEESAERAAERSAAAIETISERFIQAMAARDKAFKELGDRIEEMHGNSIAAGRELALVIGESHAVHRETQNSIEGLREVVRDLKRRASQND